VSVASFYICGAKRLLLLFHRYYLLSGNSGPAERGGRRTGHASHL